MNNYDIQEKYENLANAIILRAVKDYRRSNNEETLLEIERFFQSDWFSVLTGIDPEYLISKLRKEKENHEKQQTKRRWNRS